MSSAVFVGVGLPDRRRRFKESSMMLVAVVSAVMLVGALLAPSTTYLVASGDLGTKARELITGSTVSSDQVLLDQLAAVGDGLSLDTAVGPMDASFMLAGPAFTHGDTPFSVATSTYLGAAVEAVVPVADGDRILYERGDVTEWWQTVGSSYQQGWTVAAAPADGSTELSLLVGFGNAAPVAESDTTVRLLLSDGSVVWYRDLVAFDANDTILPATMTVDGSNVRIDVDATGAVYPVTIDPIVDADQQILAPATATGDQFGEAIATDGRRMAVSAREADRPGAPDPGTDRGRVDVFDWSDDDGEWILLDSVDYPGGGSADFGWSVDINGDFLVVGAPLDDTNGANAGAVFMYEWDGTDYNLVQSIYECDASVAACDGSATGNFAGQLFGYDVAVSSNKRVAIGAPGNGISDTGDAYVYTPAGAGAPMELASSGYDLGATARGGAGGPVAGDRFGEAIDITADDLFVIVGEPGDDTDATDEGKVWLFDSQGAAGYDTAGTEVGPSNGVSQEYGASVAIGTASDGNIVAVVGRPFRTRRNPVDVGVGGVEVLLATPGGFGSVALGDISAFTSNDGFGHDVAFANNTVLVGAPYNNGVDPERGFAYGYTYLEGGAMDGGVGASAVQLANPLDFAADGGDHLGWAVAIVETFNLLVAGLPGHDEVQNGRVAGDAGRIATWTPGGAVVDAVGAELTARTDDSFGAAVAVSGNRMAASAPTDDATLFSSGGVLLYERATSTDPWVFDTVLAYPDAASETAGLYGASLDMEGNFLAVGTSTGQFGRVDVYEYAGGEWTLRDALEGAPGDNLTNSLEFGSDVAISTDGDVLVVGMTGYDYAGCDDCGAVRVFDWDGGSYVSRGLIDDGEAFGSSGRTLDMDEIPGSSDMRLVIGNDFDGLGIYNIADGLGAPITRDDFFDVPSGAGESVAIDNDRIVTAALSGGSDVLLVIDRNADGTWISREIFSGDLFTGPGATPNNQVDVSGDTIAIGRSDGLGGELGVFYNDPSFGWGQTDVTEGWIDGPLDRIQPSDRAAADQIGRAVAIDGAGADKTIVFGAPGTSIDADDSGAVYASVVTEAGGTQPNKVVGESFASPGELGSVIAAGVTPFGPTAVVGERSGRKVHRLEPSGTNWEIVQTISYSANVIDLDLRESDGVLAVLLGDGEVFTYREDVCAGADCAFTQFSGPFDVGTVTAGSIALNGTTDDTLVMITAGSGDQFQQLINFGDFGNGPVGAPSGLVPSDDFGASADTEGRYTFIGTPGFDTGLGANTGRIYVWDNQNESYPLTIDGQVAGGRFGSSVAIDGDTLVVGAENDGVGADGLAYVYDIETAGAISATRVATLSPVGGSGLSHWGASVAIDGDVIVLGAPGYEESGVPFRDGTAVAFGFDGASWQQTDLFDHVDDADGDQAGTAVAVVGSDVFVGVPLDDNSQGADAGAVYSYVASPAVPAIPNKVVTPDSSGQFGRELAVSGTTAVVAEPLGGRVHILTQVAGVWSITQTFNEPNVVDVDIDDAAGRMVVLSTTTGSPNLLYYERIAGDYVNTLGTTLSADGTPDAVLLTASSVYVGKKNTTTAPLTRLGWLDVTPGQAFTPVGIESGDETGAALAENDGIVFVGAPRWDDTAGDDAGRVYIFDNDSNTFTGTIDAASPGKLFGWSLDADGGRLAVGSLGFGPAPDSGLVETYTNLTTTGADLEQVIVADDVAASDFFGFSVDLEADVLVVGTPAKVVGGTRTGQAYSYRFVGGTWTQQDTFTASDNDFDDQFGNAIGVSGTSVLVGSPFDDNQRGVDAGAVYSFVVTDGDDNPSLVFDLTLDPNGPTSVAVAPSGIAVSEFNTEVLENASDDGTSIAAAGLGETDIAESPLSSLPLSSLPLSSLAAAPGSAISAIPLIEIDLEGGWQLLFDDAGSSLGEVPLVDLTFADVVNDTAARNEFDNNRTLAQLNVQGSPLSSLPLSSLVIGNTPLSSLSAEADWCAILAGYVENICGARPLASVTVLEATLSGVPLSSLPLSSLPLSSLPLSSLPLSSLPLSSLDLSASPLSSLPLSSLPLSSLGPVGSPLSSLPLSSLPLSSLPLSSLELNGSPLSSLPLSSLPLSSLELSGVPLSSLPLSSLEVNGAPLSSLPLSSLPLSSLVLADAPLSSLPLSSLDPSLPDWCTYLAELDLGFDCSFAADPDDPASVDDFLDDTTIADLGVRGIPLSSLPLSSLPLSSLALNGSPLSSLPLSSLPLSSLPLSSLPLSSLPLSSLDLTGTPLSSLGADLASLPLSSLDVAGSPLSSLPLSSLDLTGTPLSSLPLSSLPLSSLPLSSLPLSSLSVAGSPLSSLPLSSLDVSGTPLSSLPLSSLNVAGAPLSSLGVDCTLADCDVDSLGDAIGLGALNTTTVTLASLLPWLSGVRLGDIADALTTGTRADIEAAVDALDPSLTLGNAPSLDDLLLGDLPQNLTEVRNTVLGQLESALWSVRFSALLGAIRNPATGEPFGDADVESALDVAFGTSVVGDIENLGDATVGDLLDGDDGSFTFADLGPILGLIHVVDVIPGLTDNGDDLGDLLLAGELGGLTLLDLIGLGEAEFDDITLTELLVEADAAGALYGFDLADLLLALIGIDLTPFSNLEFTEVETGQLPDSLLPPVTFVAEFTVNDTTRAKTVDLSAQLPATASYVPGSTVITDDGGNVFTAEPVADGNTLSWSVSGVIPTNLVSVEFDVKPTVTIGSTSISATANIQGTDAGGSASAAVSIVEGTEPNDFPTTTTAVEDTVYLTYISSETDNDVFSITIGENDELAIQLSSLSVDLDVALYGDPANDAVAAALTNTSDESPLEPIADPDQDGADTEPLNDFRRLDEEDADLQFIDLSNSPGIETELLVTGALPAGTYYVQVFGANGATNVEPAALQIQILDGDDRPFCSANGAIVGGNIGNFPALTGSTANTLILVNEQRTEALYPGEWADLETEIDELVAYLDANPQLGIEPIVVSLDGNGTVQGAYSAWDTDSTCSPESANGVVQAIVEQAIDPLRDTLEHVMIIGGDQVIPMARLLDATEIANEYDYRHEFIGDNGLGNADNINALSATFWDRQYLSDEPYGESSARSLGNRFLYVSDIALGRMVETPDEIQGALQHFQDFDGALDADTAAILGYDFLVDSSEEIAADLVAAGLTVDDDLADGLDGTVKWDKDDAASKIIPAGGAADLISFNGHFDHYRALPADGDQVPGFTNNFLAETVSNATPGILEGSIVFSMGCHGGLSVSDLQIANTNGDWAQTFAADQAIFIGNTGFGYGDTEAVAYTEKLMALFAEKAVRPTQVVGQMGTTTIGQALTFAKNEYASDLSVFSVYDEKALMESTFYGIPFYRVGATPVPADPVPTNITTPDSTGNQSISVIATPENNLETTALGDIYSNPDENGDPQTIVAPGMPIQPSQSFDVTVVDPADSSRLGTVARGALVLDMSSTYVAPTDPVVSTAIFNESLNQPEPDLGTIVFPAKPVTINTTTTPGGQRQSLVLATGQFNSEGDVQRLDNNLDVVVYYADEADTDYTAPTIGAVESTLTSSAAGAELTVTLEATDAGGSVTRVYVLVAGNPGSGTVDWVGIDLAKESGSDDWSGSALLPVGTNRAKFIVQAVDSSGNVGFATNKARNFDDDDTVVPDPPTPGLSVTVDPTNLDTPTGWYTGPVDISVVSGGQTATYLVQPGGVTTTVPAGGVFTVSRNGVNTVTVTRADGQKITKTVRIDTVDPVVSIAPPANGAVFLESAVPNVGFVCQDPSPTSCVATVNGAAITNGAPLPSAVGSYTVVVTATDVLGNTASKTVGYVVQPDVPVGDPPTILEIEIDGVALPGEPVDLYGEFVDGVAPYEISVDWGDGNVCPSAGGCSVDAPDAGMPGIFEGTYTYPTGGSYTVEVTITDATGASVSTTVTTATCTIVGTNGNNYINGTNGDDVICGLDGNDWINGRGGLDIIFGGRGHDTIRGGNGADVLYGGRGNDVLLGQNGDDTMVGGLGWDLLSGGSGADRLLGRQGNDVLLGGNGNDTLIGNGGNDQLFGGGHHDRIEGRRGDDFISGSFGNDTIEGGSGDDNIFASFGNDIVNGGGGEDWVSGGSGSDTIDGGDDDDDLRGDWGNDTIEGGNGTDRCRGGGGTDQLTGCEL